MSTEVQVTRKNFDGLKWLFVLLLIVVGVVANQYFSADSLLYRVMGLLILGGIVCYIAMMTQRGKRFGALLKEAKVEIRKVVWPTQSELTQTTLIVVGFVLFVALLLWGLDSLISLAVSGIIG